MMSEISDSSDKDFNIDDYDVDSEDSFEDEDNDNDNNVKKDSKEDEKHGHSKDAQAEPQERTFVGQALQNGHKFNNKLVCVKYPGNVVNPEKAIETLGGIVVISETVKSKNKRLELRFRPDDGYCKPACGDRHQTAGFLLRVRVKKSRFKKIEEAERMNNEKKAKEKEKLKEKKTEKNHSSHENESENESTNNVEDESVNKLNHQIITYDLTTESSDDVMDKNVPPSFEKNKYENLSEDPEYQLPKLKVLGRVESEFRFTNLCDFQYLPVTKSLEDPTKDECVYNSVYPVDLPPYSWLKKEVPYFLPPAAFSRMDTVQPYAPKTEQNPDEVVIGKTRKRRAGFSNFISFKTPGVPVNPPKGIETAMKVKFLQSSHLEKIRQYFNERPIWSKTALMYLTKFSNEQMKVLLPSVAYYFMTGPWRITWVRLGYDPRKDPSSRIYQVLDYRLKAMHGLHSSITCKRNYSEYTLPYKNTSNSKAKAMVLTPQSDQISQKQQKLMDENVYIYRPGTIPPSRQMFYQYCDVHVDEIQENLAKYVNPPPGTQCDEKSGWLSKDFDSYCREVINKQVRLELRKMLKIPENLPTSLPRKRKLAPTGKTRKRYPKKPKPEKPACANQQPVAEDDIPSEDEDYDELEDILDEEDFTANESDIDPDVEDEIDFDTEKD